MASDVEPAFGGVFMWQSLGTFLLCAVIFAYRPMNALFNLVKGLEIE